jgi:hypothetical protein
MARKTMTRDKMRRARADYEKLAEEMAPFTVKKLVRPVSTSGQWRSSPSPSGAKTTTCRTYCVLEL